MSLKYEPASEPLHIYVKWLFLNWELCRTGDLSWDFPGDLSGEETPSLPAPLPGGVDCSPLLRVWGLCNGVSGEGKRFGVQE